LSTRGCVAIKTETGWRGVYNHSDSYPSGLGKELWEHLKENDLNKFAEELLRYDDWRNYLAGGVCPYCGRRGLSQPHSITGGISGREFGKVQFRGLGNYRFKTKREMCEYYRGLPAWRGRNDEIEREIEHEWEIRRNIRRTGFPDPEAKYHRHRPLVLSEQQITSENPDPLFIEWAYVIDPRQRSMEILTDQGFGTHGPAGVAPTPAGDGFFDYGHCRYRHVRVARVSLDGEEPNWGFLESLVGKPLALEDLMSQKQLILEQLKEGRIKKSECALCHQPVLTYDDTAVHSRCLRKALEELGGDAGTWIQGLKLEFKHMGVR